MGAGAPSVKAASDGFVREGKMSGGQRDKIHIKEDEDGEHFSHQFNGHGRFVRLGRLLGTG
ncbi:hypothetical protein VCV18_002376 [Metarhizium anisopliae]